MKELSEILKLITNGTAELENTDMFDLVSLPSDDSTTSSETSSVSSDEDLKLRGIENLSDNDSDNVSESEVSETDELSNWQNISPQEILEDLKEIKEKLNLMNNNMESAAEMFKLNGSQMEIEFKNIQNELRQFRQRMDNDNATINECNFRKTPINKSYLNLADREKPSLFNQRSIRILFLMLLILLLFFAAVSFLPNSAYSSSFNPINYKMTDGKVPV